MRSTAISLTGKGGGWWQELAPDMVRCVHLVGQAGFYHSYQALLLPSLPLSPTAATELARLRAS